jgi:predicted nuclease of restriction endonuclease-like (RecB) superfamily
MSGKSSIKEYRSIVAELKEKIRSARSQAVFTVNRQLLTLYWEIGHTISRQEKSEGWGAKVVETLSKDLSTEFPDLKGLSPRNLRYMRDFAVAYPQFGILQAPLAKLPDSSAQPAQPPLLHPSVAKLETASILQAPLAKLSDIQSILGQISWYHHITLLEKVKSLDERIFYIRKTIENGWSRNVMLHHIGSNLYKRQGRALTNFEATLPQHQSILAKETLKNPYIFDFLSISEEMQERDVEQSLIRHIRKFMLELGKGFAYVGNQYNLNVDGDDYFLDLLFYNYHLHCFVIFELKIGDFKPEYAGKLNFYVNTVNEQIKGKSDNPTIGVLLCKTPNDTVIRFTLKGISTPLGVADYKLAQSLPQKFKSQMPTVKELEEALEGDLEKSPSDVSPVLSRMKDAIKKKSHSRAAKKGKGKSGNG